MVAADGDTLTEVIDGPVGPVFEPDVLPPQAAIRRLSPNPIQACTFRSWLLMINLQISSVGAYFSGTTKSVIDCAGKV
jgi:hypothetical protein